MRARYLLLVLLGVALGRADKVWTGEPKWLLDSDTERSLTRLERDLTDLRLDKRFDLRPPERGRASTNRPDLLGLRGDCLALENRALAELQAHPDTIAHQYCYLRARAVTSTALNLLLWHDLDEIATDELPIVAPVGTVSSYAKSAKERFGQTSDVANGLSEFWQARW